MSLCASPRSALPEDPAHSARSKSKGRCIVDFDQWGDRAQSSLGELLQTLVEQQADLLAHQAGLLSLVESRHQDLCARLDRGFPAFPMPSAFPVPDALPLSASISTEATVDPKTKNSSTFLVLPSVPDTMHAPEAQQVQSRRVSAWFLRFNRAALAKWIDDTCTETIMGLIIVLNLLTLLAQGQWKGMEIGYQLGLHGFATHWPSAAPGFHIAEICFCTIYALESGLRVVLNKGRHLRNIWHVADLALVVLSCIDAFVLTPMRSANGEALQFAPIVRIIRVFRIFRILRVVVIFKELFLMLRALIASLPGFLWSMLLVGFIITSSGVLMSQLTLGVLEDKSASLELRRWVYSQFGTAARSSYTMFEATFTTSWTDKARRLIMEVNPWFSVFWVFYIVAINFAVTRVIAALFLKQTLAVANSDHERETLEKMQRKNAFAEQIRQIFVMADKNADRLLNREEFEDMLEDADVLAIFSKLELEVHEVRTVFELVSDRDGVADYEEFLAGALKMKNSARTLDIVQVMHEQMVLQKSVDKLTRAVKRVQDVVTAAYWANSNIKDPSEGMSPSASIAGAHGQDVSLGFAAPAGALERDPLIAKTCLSGGYAAAPAGALERDLLIAKMCL